MIDIIVDTLLDLLKILPFLYLTFLLIELFEDKFSAKSEQLVSNRSFLTTILSAFLGIVPQCGFSVMATNLYTTRIIRLSTLIAIYLSTSDEMLPLLISSGASFNEILKIILLKVLIACLVGLILFFIDKRSFKADYSLCEKDDCNCEEKGPFLAALKHTMSTMIYLLIITLILNITVEFLGKDVMQNLLLQNTIFAPFISSLVGLVPNCATSILITQLYLEKMITLGSALAGLLSNSGIALLVLFKTNKNKKENLMILAIVYFVGALSGLVITLLGI